MLVDHADAGGDAVAGSLEVDPLPSIRISPSSGE
jgi:hypothetical protein